MCLHVCQTTNQDGFQIMGDGRKPIDEFYKWDKWRKGQNIPKKLRECLDISNKQNSIWNLDYNSRYEKMKKWAYEINREKREDLADLMVDLRSLEADLKALHKVTRQPIFT